MRWGFAALAAWGILGSAAAGAETVCGRESSGAFSWGYCFDAQFADAEARITVKVNLIPASGISRSEFDRARKGWERGVDQVWNRRFALVTPDGRRYPIVISLVQGNLAVHYEVVVRPQWKQTDLLNWSLQDSPLKAAHEFGHMLGAFDEYRRGATGPAGGGGGDSIMGNRSAGTAYPRHLEKVRQWFLETSALKEVSVETLVAEAKSGGGK